MGEQSSNPNRIYACQIYRIIDLPTRHTPAYIIYLPETYFRSGRPVSFLARYSKGRS